MGKSKKKKNRNKNLQPEPIDPIQKNNNKRFLFFVLSTFFLLIICYSYIFDTKFDLNGDNIRYYLLGKALAVGKGFVNIWEAGEPASAPSPPVYPLILSLVVKMFSFNMTAMKIFNGILFFIASIFFFLTAKKITNDKTLVIFSLILVAVNSHLLRYSTILMTEIPFLFFLMVSLYSVIKIDFKKQWFKEPWFWVMVIFIGFAYYTRTAGLALIVAFPLYFVLERKWPYVIATGVLLIAITIPWYIWMQGHSEEGFLGAMFLVDPYNIDKGFLTVGGYIKRTFLNIFRYIFSEIPNACFPMIEHLKNKKATGIKIAGLISSSFIVFGIIRLKTNRNILLSIICCMFGMLFLWTDAWKGVRFILPITPILLFLMINGVLELLEIMIKNKTLCKWIGVAILCICVGISFYGQNKERYWAKLPYPPNYLNFFKVASWARFNMPDGKITASRVPPFWYLFSDKQGVSYVLSGEDEKILNQFDKDNIDYVVLDMLGPQSPKYLFPMVARNKDKFKKVVEFSNPPTILYEYKKKAAITKEADKKRERCAVFAYNHKP